MYNVTQRFLDEIRRSHTVLATAELYSKGEIIDTLPIISGSVTDDSEAIQRRRMTIELPGTRNVINHLAENAPANGGLWPLGNEIRILAGVEYDDGLLEMVSMGWFRISKPKLADSEGGLTITIDGYDHSRTISRARFTQPYNIKQGVRYHVAIRDLMKNRMPSLTEDDFLFEAVPNYTTPNLVFTQDDDPMDVAIKMAGSLGCELFFNGDRKVVLRTQPDPSVEPADFDYREGEDATIVEISRELDDDQTYNGVIVSGETSSNEKPIRGEAWDTNPNSPTYFDPDNPEASDYGPVPYFITSEYVTTPAQAVAAAEANLMRVSGVVEAIDFSSISNVAHESNDIVWIQRDRVNVNDAFVLSSIDMGLGATTGMSGSVRKRRVR